MAWDVIAAAVRQARPPRERRRQRRRPTPMTARVVSAVAVLLLALAGCGTGDAELVATVSGLVEAGPTCPVETPEHPCPPAPVAGARVEVLLDGEVVATTTTDSDGRFEIGAPEGTVQVRAQSVDGLPSEDVETFVLTPGDDVDAVFELDTGIR